MLLESHAAVGPPGPGMRGAGGPHPGMGAAASGGMMVAPPGVPMVQPMVPQVGSRAVRC
jgi:hypothetical protein